MLNFVDAKCPNCEVKIRVDRDKKYQDCPFCKAEFRTADIIKEDPAGSSNPPKSSFLDNLKKLH